MENNECKEGGWSPTQLREITLSNGEKVYVSEQDYVETLTPEEKKEAVERYMKNLQTFIDARNKAFGAEPWPKISLPPVPSECNDHYKHGHEV